MLKEVCLELSSGEEYQKMVKGCWFPGVTEAEITRQGCKISQTEANRNRQKVSGLVV